MAEAPEYWQGCRHDIKPAAAGSRYFEQPRPRCESSIRSSGAALDTDMVCLASWVVGDWAMGRKKGAYIARGAHNLPWETHEKVVLWADCSSARQATRTGFGRCDRLACRSTAFSRSSPDQQGDR